MVYVVLVVAAVSLGSHMLLMKSIDVLIREATEAAGVPRETFVVREHPILSSVFFCDLCREHIMMIPNEQPVVFCDYPQWAFHVNCQFAASIKMAEENEEWRMAE